jgi:MoaA/NifB/PqqE/SkfB family radical SAM enzyme
MDAYSPLKALRHLDVVQAVRAGKPVRPVHVQVILSDLCNQSCDFCAYRDPTYSSSQKFWEIARNAAALRRDAAHLERDYNPNRKIPFGKVVEILDDCASLGVQAVQFTGGGEPTVHPEWAAAIFEARYRALQVALVTNGVNVSRTERGLTAARQCAWVRVSIDAATAETYMAMRHAPEAHFAAAWRTVRALSDNAYRPDRPVVGVGFVVTPANWREIYDAAALAKDAGADNIRIGAQFSSQEESLFAGFHDAAAALARKAETLTDGGFTVFNRFGEKLADLRSKRPDYELCGYQHFTTYIGADLNVYRCCVTAYNDAGLIGSLKEQRFAALWMSAERASSMAAFRATSCERCQFNGQNRPLDYVLRPEATHAEFV